MEEAPPEAPEQMSEEAPTEAMQPTEENFAKASELTGKPPIEPELGETPSMKQLRLKNLWTRWKEWGSPFATAPMSVSGTNALDKVRVGGVEGYRMRFIGRLSHAMPVMNTGKMTWLYIKRLVVDPFAELTLSRMKPWKLEPGKTYEFRLLARDRSAPRAEDIKKRLGEMGFAPMKLSALKHNIRLPRRPTSLSLWFGIGQWMHSPSVVTVEDPLYFEEVQDITKEA